MSDRTPSFLTVCRTRGSAWASGMIIGAPELSTSVVKNGVKVQSITILGKECAVADEVRVQNCVCLPYKELKRVSCCQSFPWYEYMC